MKMNRQAKGNQKQCFSYIRFSSAKQADGTSEDRQLEVAPRVADEKEWFLREDLTVKNLGVSSYKGTNKETLEAIIQSAKDGIIPQGSVMIIEGLDRASRFTIDEGYQLIRAILLAGVEIYNDKIKRHLTKSSLNNLLEIMEVLFELNAAFQYSDMLSQRVGKAWRIKRESLYDGTGNKLSENCVKWIDGKTWEPIPEKVKTIKRIFELYNDGHGITAIIKVLNGEKVPNLGRGKKGWNSGYVWAILHSRAVIGEFQPYKTHTVAGRKSYARTKLGDAIPNYYPPIIDESLFYQVQAKMGDAKQTVKTGKIGNLFSGVAFCECGEKMYLASSKKNGVTRNYYMCWGKLKGMGCNTPTIPYTPIEGFFLSTIVKNAHKLFTGKKQDNSKLIELRGRVAEMETQISNITQAVIGGKATKALVEAQSKLETDLDAMRSELAIAESMAANKVQVDTSKDFVSVTFKELTENINVRRKARDFILGHVGIMEFPLDRKTVRIGFKNENQKANVKMIEDTLETLKQS